MENNICGMGFKLCPVTKKKHSEVLLFNQDLRKEMPLNNFMGYEYSEEVKDKLRNGYVVIIEITNGEGKEKIKTHEAESTGLYCYLKRKVAEKMFNLGIEDLMYASKDVMEVLNNLSKKNEKDNED